MVPEPVGQPAESCKENPVSKRVALTVESKNGLQSLLDPRFGRARAFLIVDPDGREIVAELDNESADLAQGAGTGAAATMSSHGVGTVISGGFGPQAEQALRELGIEMRVAPADLSAEKALEMLDAGTLGGPASSPAAEPGRGRGMGGGGLGRGCGRAGGGGMGRGGGGGQGGGGRGRFD